MAIIIDNKKDYYAILGVLPIAEDVVIKGAYRALAQRYHPDRFHGNEYNFVEHMAEINEAYRILSDAEMRAEYDRSREPFSKDRLNCPISDKNIEFECEQFRAFADKLKEWGYDESKICEALIGRGVRQTVAQHLAATLAGKSKQG